MDDQWTVAHLALSPEIDLCGVITTHAPNLADPAAETAARVVAEVLARVHLSGTVPILVGSSVPLVGDRPRLNQGVDFLLEAARGQTWRDRLTVLVIGAATDVASALLIDPSLGERIEIVAMAFDGWPDGGDSFNVRNDLAAWRILLSSAAPIAVADAAVTRRDLALTPALAQRWLGAAGPAGDYLIGLLRAWIDAHPDLVRRVTGDPSVWPIWDQAVVAHLLGLTESETHPRPRVRDDYRFDHAATQQEITWITRIDAARLWADLHRNLQRLGAPPP